MSSAFDQVKTGENKRVSEQIYENIRDMIIEGKLKPGDTLPPEAELVEIYHRSRPVIRESLRMLESAGLVKITAGNKGAQVTLPNMNHALDTLAVLFALGEITIENLNEYRLANDVMIAGLAAERRTEEDVVELADYLGKMREAVCAEEFDTARFLFLNKLAKCSYNNLLIMFDNVMQQARPTIMRILRARVQQKTENAQPRPFSRRLGYYQDLFGAIKEQDAEKARELVRQHIIRNKV